MSGKLKINKSYAENYNKWRQKEELAKLKSKYSGSKQDADSEESSSESEDDEAEGLTEEIERDWMKTLAALKNKDPIIYQKDAHFYHDDAESSNQDQQKKKKEKHKPMYLKDYERKILIEKGGVVSDESDNEDHPMPQKGYYEQQEELKKSLLAAVGDSDASSDDELLTAKPKEERQQAQETSSQGTSENGETETEKAGPLKNYWYNPNLDEGEKFLRDYILGKKYINPDGKKSWTLADDDDEDDHFSEEEELLVKQDTFERKYNFRFEEPEGDKIKTYPRDMEDSVRRKSTKRRDDRQKAKDRKLKEKAHKKEELKQLKNLKKQEILDKLGKLREITGNKDLQFNEDELEKDFDPEEHDKMMQQQFDGYYDEAEVDESKPVFYDSGDEFEEEKWDNWQGQEDGTEYFEQDDAECYEPHVDDPDFNMDADYDPSMAPKKSKKKKKKKNKFAEALEAEKPVYDPSENTFDEYLDEYYKLDYEDIIDDMPCRFRYRKTVPNDYGLTASEVLAAPEKELNAWAALKKMTQYRSEQEEMTDVHMYSKKGKSMKKKKNILPSLYQPKEEDSLQTFQGKDKTKEKSKDKFKDKDKVMEVNTGKDNVKGKDKIKVKDKNIGKNKIINKAKDGIKDKNKEENIQKTQNTDTHFTHLNQTQKPDASRKGQSETLSTVTASSEIATKDSRKEKKRKKKLKAANMIVKKQKLDSDSVHNENELVTGDETEIGSSTNAAEISPAFVTDHNQEKKKENKNLEKAATGQNETKTDSQNLSSNKKKKKKKKKKNQQFSNRDDKMHMTDERLKAYGINPKRYKYMKKEELFIFKNEDND